MSGASEDDTPANTTSISTTTATAHGSSTTEAGADSNGVTATTGADSSNDELRQLAAEDGSAEESNTAPVGDQDGAEIDGVEEVTKSLEATGLDGDKDVNGN